MENNIKSHRQNTSHVQHSHSKRSNIQTLKPISTEGLLPIQTVSSIAIRSIPSNNSLSSDAAIEVQKLTKEFITIVSSEAGSNVMKNHKKVLTGDDIIHGLSNLGYSEYADSLKIYLDKYREAKLYDEQMEAHETRMNTDKASY